MIKGFLRSGTNIGASFRETPLFFGALVGAVFG